MNLDRLARDLCKKYFCLLTTRDSEKHFPRTILKSLDLSFYSKRELYHIYEPNDVLIVCCKREDAMAFLEDNGFIKK